MSRRPLLVIGTGGLAREMAQLVRQIDSIHPAWEFMGYVAADQADVGRDLTLGRVVGDDGWLLSSTIEADLVIGVGHPAARATAIRPFLEQGERFRFPNLIHPSAQVDGDWVHLGRGNVVTAGCILTVDIRIGDFNLLNLGVTVGHDAAIGDANVVNPSVNVSGAVSIGDRVLVGTGAQILEGRSVGSDAIVAAGAVVTRDVVPGTTVMGVPARVRDDARA